MSENEKRFVSVPKDAIIYDAKDGIVVLHDGETYKFAKGSIIVSEDLYFASWGIHPPKSL